MATKTKRGWKEDSADDKRMDRIEKKYGIKEGSPKDKAIDRAMSAGKPTKKGKK